MSGSTDDPGFDGMQAAMSRFIVIAATAGCLLIILSLADAAFAQRRGAVLKVYHWDSPASMSIHEEATLAAEGPMMGVFNNLVLYDQHVPRAGPQSIIADLATSWSSNEEKTRLTFRLVWKIERKLAEDAARSILYHIRAGTCWQPYVKEFNLMENGGYNELRMADVWLDR